MKKIFLLFILIGIFYYSNVNATCDIRISHGLNVYNCSCEQGYALSKDHYGLFCEVCNEKYGANYIGISPGICGCPVNYIPSESRYGVKSCKSGPLKCIELYGQHINYSYVNIINSIKYDNLLGRCYCANGYSWNSNKTKCIYSNNNIDSNSSIEQSSEKSDYGNSICKRDYGFNSYYSGTKTADGKYNCNCNSGYELNKARTSCIKTLTESEINDYGNSICKRDYGSNSYYDYTNSDGIYICDCNSGYKWNEARTSCIIDLTKQNNSCNIKYPGTVYRELDDKCICPNSNNEWDSISKTCQKQVDIKKTITENKDDIVKCGTNSSIQKKYDVFEYCECNEGYSEVPGSSICTLASTYKPTLKDEILLEKLIKIINMIGDKTDNKLELLDKDINKLELLDKKLIEIVPKISKNSKTYYILFGLYNKINLKRIQLEAKRRIIKRKLILK